MLTAGQVRELRDSVQASLQRPWQGACVYVACLDGPLQGLRFRLAPHELTPRMIVGWCTHTDAGAVVAYYVATGEKGKLQFRGYERPGATAGAGYPIRGA
jgi:hypothetical protein